MPRSGERVRRLLQEAALSLYGERGFGSTTTADIAARAGVTERTYFRHFSDKREVLFDGEATLRDQLVAGVRDAPPDNPPLAVLGHAFRAVLPLFEANRPFAAPRAAVIQTSTELQERAIAKQASLTGALAAALRDRGTPDRTAVLAAEVGMAALARAVKEWLEEPEPTLEVRLQQVYEQVQNLSV